ncbi:amidohydrolase [Selenomonadales bacterium OttesenSCG-928-I06]|nr:amidohydrolase [Selenomonadales bacterium OttesenSCG-928-I06]
MSGILLKNGQVLLPNGEVELSDVYVVGSEIKKIGLDLQEKNAEIIDCQDKLITPGFIDAHGHMAMTLFRSYGDDLNLMDWLNLKIWPAEAKLTGEDVYWGTMLAVAEMIKSGTTTAADMYFFMDEVARAVDESGFRASLSRGITSTEGLKQNEELFNNFHNSADGRITVMLGPHAIYTCSLDFLKETIKMAEKLNCPIHIHVSETTIEVENCMKEHGRSPVEVLDSIGLFEVPTLAAHCVHMSDKDIQIMAEKNVKVAHNPGSNMKLASGVAPVPKMLAANMCVALATDGASSNNNLNMLHEIRLAALLHKVYNLDPLAVPAKTALSMATRSGAEALNLGKVGELKEGYKADITIFNTTDVHWCPKHDLRSLLVYAGNSSDVDTVIINGKKVLSNKKLLTIDEERVVFEANRRAFKLTEK